MAAPPVVHIIDSDDDDDDDDANAKVVSKPKPKPKALNTSINPTNIIDVEEDTPTPTTIKSSSFVPETPLSILTPPPLHANSSSGDESIPDDEGLEKRKNMVEREIDFESWLDVDSNVCLFKGGEPNVNGEGKGLGKRTSMENGRTLTDVEQNSKKRPKVVAKENCHEKERVTTTFNVESDPDVQSTCHFGNSMSKTYDRIQTDNVTNQMQPSEDHDRENEVRLEKGGAIHKPECGDDANAEKKKTKVNQANRKKLTEDERLVKQQEKLRKAELKDEAAKQKQLQKEKRKLENYKFNEKDIVALIDPKVLSSLVGGPLLTMFGQKDITYEITPNLFEKSIIWRMSTPKDISQHTTVKIDVQYILLIYGDAEEFCKRANDGSLMDHIASVQKHYPSYTICCLTNRLMSFINKREQQKYKQQKVASDWIRPPVEELFAKLTTQFSNVHIRQCVDEAEVAEHVVGLTINLVKCHSRKKPTHLSVNANGRNVTKDCVYRNDIKKSPWLKALVSIPKVQPRQAIAIGKNYRTMKSLLRVYMDPTKTVHEKELLLEDLPLDDGRKVGPKCSKSIYRILMAKNGSIVTDEAVNGADNFFSQDQLSNFLVMEKSKSMPEYSSYVKANYAFEDGPRAYTFNGPSNNGDEFGGSGNPEVKRKKRVASYNMYAMEGKLKSTFRNSFKWIKSKFSDDYFDV